MDIGVRQCRGGKIVMDEFECEHCGFDLGYPCPTGDCPDHRKGASPWIKTPDKEAEVLKMFEQWLADKEDRFEVFHPKNIEVKLYEIRRCVYCPLPRTRWIWQEPDGELERYAFEERYNSVKCNGGKWVMFQEVMEDEASK